MLLLSAFTGSITVAGLVPLFWWGMWPGPALISLITPYLGVTRPRLPHRIIRILLRGAETSVPPTHRLLAVSIA